jgi:hypothetical protein
MLMAGSGSATGTVTFEGPGELGVHDGTPGCRLRATTDRHRLLGMVWNLGISILGSTTESPNATVRKVLNLPGLEHTPDRPARDLLAQR